MPIAQSTISSRTVQPTRATIAVTSRTEPAAWRASVRRIPSNGATNTWLTLRMADDEAVGLPGVEQEQDDPGADDDLDEPEDEDDDPAGHLGRAWAGRRGALLLGPDGLLDPSAGGLLGDDRLVDLFDGHGFLRAEGIRGSGVKEDHRRATHRPLLCIAVNHVAVLLSTVDYVHVNCGSRCHVARRSGPFSGRRARSRELSAVRRGPSGRDLGGLPEQARERRGQEALAARPAPAERRAGCPVRRADAPEWLPRAGRRTGRAGGASGPPCSPTSPTMSGRSSSSTSPGIAPVVAPAEAGIGAAETTRRAREQRW